MAASNTKRMIDKGVSKVREASSKLKNRLGVKTASSKTSMGATPKRTGIVNKTTASIAAGTKSFIGKSSGKAAAKNPKKGMATKTGSKKPSMGTGRVGVSQLASQRSASMRSGSRSNQVSR